MFGIGFAEMLVILAVALLVVGPDKLPGLARSWARTLLELKKTAENIKNDLMAENHLSGLDTLKTELLEIKPDLQEAAKRFQEQILDVADKEIKVPPENTATGKTTNRMPEKQAPADSTATTGSASVNVPQMERQPEEPKASSHEQ